MNWYRVKIALRLMLRQRFFTFLNLAGLSLGTAAFLLIYLYVADELSYDKFHTDSKNIFRVNMTNIWIESNDVFGSTSPAVKAAILNDIPEVERAIRIHEPFSEELITITNQDGTTRSFQESGIMASDDGFFQIFTFPLLEGKKQTALSEPNSVVLTKSIAKKYFGEVPAIGKQIILGTGQNQKVLSVTGVIDDVPNQSHYRFDMMLSMTSFPFIRERSDSWIWTGFVTYLSLNPEADVAAVNRKLAVLPRKYVGDEKADEKDWKLSIQNIEDIRLYSGEIGNRLGPVGSIDNVIIFGTVAAVILLLSCINFMNLSTAKFTNRAKEIGLQKVFGSTKNSLRLQFLTESTIYSLVSVVIGFGLAELTKPFFNTLASKQLSLNLFQSPELIIVMLGLVLLIGLASGFYPAWFMTRFKITDSVKGKISTNGSKAGFRNILVLFQFTISIALIASSLLVKDQLSYLQNRDLGFDEEKVLVIRNTQWMLDEGTLLADRLKNEGVFQNTAITNSVPPSAWYQDNFRPLNSTKTEELSVTMMNADPSFTEVLGLELLAGRFFFESGEGDYNKLLINETCAIQMEWMKKGDDPSSVLGKEMDYYGDKFQVVGVLKDFNFWSLNNPIEPLALLHINANVFNGESRFLAATIDGDNMDTYQTSLAQAEKIWNELNPNLPFEYHFMDQAFDRAFGGQRRFGNVLDTFSVVAILIAVLGLTGLIAFTTEQKTKEFGIRKVLGATIVHLVKIVSIGFLKLLAIGVVIGSFLAWQFGQLWLANFAYSQPISPGIFFGGAMVIFSLIIVISLVITGQTARQNPAVVLRDD